ncbi:MAG TPA: DNA primase [Anaerolineae bacterium]|nr:DNA primase [Anaerolineae bacterium]
MSVVDEIKDRLDAVEVIGSYVPLKKAGQNYKGLCPFHTEKTPSFVVFPSTGTWHCFGACGIGGDIFSFVMKRENVDFGEALQILAQRAGVELAPRTPQATEADQKLARLREIHDVAAGYFHHLLMDSVEAAAARAYLTKRGFREETLVRFRVGYAPDRWDALLNHLVSRRYAVAEIAEAGLIVPREDRSGYYDRFRGRILFAICDAQGQVIGFGGRVLGDGVPKYLNSPQTPLFDKGGALFGLDKAKQGIRLAGEAVIVEGYTDVLMAHQHGIENVVAQMGTALTEAQLKLLKRHTQRFVLALDADAAGEHATLRGLDVVRQVADREVQPVVTPHGLIQYEERLAADIRIAAMPPGLDPDQVILESPARWAQIIAQAKPIMDFYFQALTADLDLGTAKGKAEAVRRLGPILAEVPDRVQRTHYLQQLSRIVQVDERSLWAQIRGEAGAAAPRRSEQQPRPARLAKRMLSLDEHCLALLLAQPAMLGSADAGLRACGEAPLAEHDLPRAEDRIIFMAWREWLASGSTPEVRAAFYDTLDESLQGRVDALLRAWQDAPQVPDEALRTEVAESGVRLRLRNLQRQVENLRFLLEDAKHTAAEEGSAGLDAQPRAGADAAYGPQITQLAARIWRLQKALTDRSAAARRQ